MVVLTSQTRAYSHLAHPRNSKPKSNHRQGMMSWLREPELFFQLDVQIVNPRHIETVQKLQILKYTSCHTEDATARRFEVE